VNAAVGDEHGRGWLRQGGWALVDQALFAGTNFLTNVLLARWLAAPEFGAFTVGFSVFLLLGTVHTAFLTEPMLVYGARQDAQALRKYFGGLVHLHAGLAALGAVGLVGLGAMQWVLGAHSLGGVLGALALSAPLILLLWLLRRACYVLPRQRDAAVASSVYLVLTILAISFLRLADALSGATAVAAMALASVPPGVWVARRLAISRASLGWSEARAVLARHVRYARWAAPAALLEWIPTNAYYVLVTLRGGLDASATLRALVNLVVPVVHANAALSTSLIPALARAQTRQEFWRTFRLGSVVLGLGALAWLAPVVVFSRPLVGWLYGGRYAADQVTVALVAVFALLTAVVGAMSAVLRSEARPERVFWPYALSAMVTCSVGLWLVLRRGLLGAAAGFALSWVAVAVVMGLLVIAMKPSTLPRSGHASGIERSQP